MGGAQEARKGPNCTVRVAQSLVQGWRAWEAPGETWEAPGCSSVYPRACCYTVRAIRSSRMSWKGSLWSWLPVGLCIGEFKVLR